MQEDEERARISWGLLADPGDRYAGALIAHEGPDAALERVKASSASALQDYFLRKDVEEPATLQHFHHWKNRLSGVDPTESLAIQRGLGIQILTPESPFWPEGVCDLGPFQPHTLWWRGDIETLGARSSWLGVVGSRQATPQGITATQEIIRQASADGYGLISGGATGIDGAAHRTAENLGLAQVAVLAGGLDRLYPRVNHDLFHRMQASGLLLSEAPCTTPHHATRFLHRNRLIAAIADAVVVVEAAWRSGAVNTARHAAALGRGLGVVPGRWEDEHSAGCYRLVRDAAATILSEPGDVSLLFTAHTKENLTVDREKGTTVFG